MKSLWIDTVKMPSFPALNDNITTDVLVIGGGMAGILTAYFLDNNNIDYVLVEKNEICSGVTQNTTAKITYQHGLIYQKLAKSSDEVAKKYLEANKLALDSYRELAKEIDCELVERDNYVYSTISREKLEDELKTLERIGYNAELVENLEIPINAMGAIKFPNQAQFHPLKFISHISKGLNIYEHTFVREMVGTTAITANGKIHAKSVICATHFPFINKHGAFFLKQYQHRSYVVALEGAQKINGMYVDEADKGMSFRSYGDILLLGGGGHRTGKNGGCYQELRAFASQHYTKSRELYRWATQDCMSLDSVPYIGRYSSSTPNFYVISGFNKWGMTSSMVAAQIICDIIMGKKNEYADIFNPSRSILKPQLLINGFETTVNMLTPTTKRCPHLGCALKYNSVENSWDCPCHGSRFDTQGQLLDNPANTDIGHRI